MRRKYLKLLTLVRGRTLDLNYFNHGWKPWSTKPVARQYMVDFWLTYVVLQNVSLSKYGHFHKALVPGKLLDISFFPTCCIMVIKILKVLHPKDLLAWMPNKLDL